MIKVLARLPMCGKRFGSGFPAGSKKNVNGSGNGSMSVSGNRFVTTSWFVMVIIIVGMSGFVRVFRFAIKSEFGSKNAHRVIGRPAMFYGATRMS